MTLSDLLEFGIGLVMIGAVTWFVITTAAIIYSLQLETLVSSQRDEIQRLQELLRGIGANRYWEERQMDIKCLEIRDSCTFIPVICLRPVPENEKQRYLLRRDGYRGDATERCIIYIDAQCRHVAYDPYQWPCNPRTHRVAHHWITEHWSELADGDVIDVEFILGETVTKKQSEREIHTAIAKAEGGK